MLSRKNVGQTAYWFIFVNLLLAGILLIYFPDTLSSILREDALAENVGTVFLLLTSLALFFAAIVLYRQPSDQQQLPWLRILLLVVAGVVFFWAAGEEISWGQRIFNWSTPETLAKVNQQGETNLHNLNTRFFNNGLETIILLAIVVPTAFHIKKKKQLFGFPLPSLSLVLGFQLVACYVTYHYIKPQDYLAYLVLPYFLYLFSKKRDWQNVGRVVLNVLLVIFVGIVNVQLKKHFPGNGPREFREYLFSVLCFCYALEMIIDFKNAARSDGVI